MPKLRRLNGKQVLNILRQHGFEVIRIKGSHHWLRRMVGDEEQNLSVPLHGAKPIAIGTLKSIYRDACDYIAEDKLKSEFYTD